MAISTELLKLLVCPLCKSTLVLKQDDKALKCEGCRHVYPVRDDIPVMLIDEARLED